MFMALHPRISTHEARAIAAEAFADPRSVRKFIEGKPLAHLPATRIRLALARLGRTDLLPSSTTLTPTAA